MKQVNVVVVVIILTIRKQKFLSLMLQINLNVKVLSLMSRPTKTRHIEWYQTSKCECKFGANVCNNKKRWNKNKCKYEYKELIDKIM